MEYGQQLEFRGKNDEALAMFESALSAASPDESSDAAAAVHDEEEGEEKEETRRAVCRAGVTRCTLRSGDLRKALRLAREAG